MEIKLESLISTAIAAIICGSVAYEVRVPIEMMAAKVCKRIDPRIIRPIEDRVTEVYEGIIATKEGLGRFFYPDNSLGYYLK